MGVTILRSVNGDRVKAAAGTAVLQVMFFYALIIGLGVEIPVVADPALRIFAIAPPPPESPAPPRERPVSRQQDNRRLRSGGSTPNIRSQPTPVQAPPPKIELIVPPIVAAPVPGPGSDPSAGAADVRGPGVGTGGRGHGTGDGFGDGAGDGDGLGGSPPRRIRGRLRDADYPRAAMEAGVGGTVGVRYRVEADGRVTGCLIDESSGSAALDGTTCRLIMERFLFEPARDIRGRPVRSTIVEYHSWIMRDDPPTADRPRRRRRLF